MAKYCRKKSMVEAWRWYGGTFGDGERFWREVTGAPWGFRFGKIGGDTGIIVWTPDGDQVLKTGEYLLKWPNGNIAPWPAALFESTFELIPEGGMEVGKWAHKDEVKNRVLQKLLVAKENHGKLVPLDEAEYRAFTGMLRTGELEWDGFGLPEIKGEGCANPKQGCANPAPADPVNHPSHYQLTIKGVQVEALDVIQGLRLGFNLGNALKYLWRHKSKGGIEDLQKARFYLDAEIKAWEERHNEP